MSSMFNKMAFSKIILLCLCYYVVVLHAEKQYKFTSDQQKISDFSLSAFPHTLYELTRNKRQVSTETETDTDEDKNWEQSQCTKLTFIDLKSVIEITQAVACKPRNTVVPIPVNPNSNLGRYFPTHVEVARCAGVCSVLSKPSCLPIKSSDVPVTITAFSSTLEKSCFTVTVTKHEQCGCECLLTESDCRAKKQLYDRNLCQCMCVDHEKESRKCQRQQMILDPDTCRCRCRKTMSCSTGHLFDPENCRCVQVANNPLIDWLS